jgi:hypothetical protein
MKFIKMYLKNHIFQRFLNQKYYMNCFVIEFNVGKGLKRYKKCEY